MPLVSLVVSSNPDMAISCVLLNENIGVKLFATLAAIATSIGFLLILSGYVLFHGGNPLALIWGPASPLTVAFNLAAALPVFAVWALPTVGWLLLVSAFRSIARQHEIVAAKLARGQQLDAILQVSAAPGFSEHHTGRAVDIGTPDSPALEEVFEQTPAFAWLQANAACFGFVLSFPRGNACGYLYEPWHWCYRQETA